MAQDDELPLESDSVDALIAHHSLDFASDPHQVLREMQRVVTPQGHLFIIGFNPYSLHGLGVFARRAVRQPLWQRQKPVSQHRLTDWLNLLGCEVQACQRVYSLPPLGRGRLRSWLMAGDNWSIKQNLPSGGVYILHALKQVPGVSKTRKVGRLSTERLLDLAVPKSNGVPSPTSTVTPIHRTTRGDVAA